MSNYDIDLIRALKQNEKPFGRMSDGKQIKAIRIGYLQFVIYCPDEKWRTPSQDGFAADHTYRLRSDYEEEPEIVECEISEKEIAGINYSEFTAPDGIENLLEGACSYVDFIGLKYEDRLTGRLYRHKKTGHIYETILLSQLNEYDVLMPDATIFRSKS